MPNAAEVATITVNGQQISNFESFQCQVVYGADYYAEATILISEASSGANAFYAATKIKNESSCDLSLAGQSVFKGGYVSQKQVAYDARSHAVQLIVKDLAADVSKSSAVVKGGQFKNYSFSAIAKSLLKPFGLNLKADGLSGEASTVFPFFTIQPGETVSEAIGRAAQARGIGLSWDGTGTLTASTSSTLTDAGTQLVEGVNILSANMNINTLDCHSNTILYGQTKGSDNSDGAAVSQVGAQYSNSFVTRYKPRILLAETPVNQKEAVSRLNSQIIQDAGAMFNVSILVKGWLKSNGNLWTAGEKVTVVSDMLDLDATTSLAVRGVTFSQGPQGTVTLLDICTPIGLQNSLYGSAGTSGADPGGSSGNAGPINGATAAKPLPFNDGNKV